MGEESVSIYLSRSREFGDHLKTTVMDWKQQRGKIDTRQKKLSVVLREGGETFDIHSFFPSRVCYFFWSPFSRVKYFLGK